VRREWGKNPRKTRSKARYWVNIPRADSVPLDVGSASGPREGRGSDPKRVGAGANARPPTRRGEEGGCREQAAWHG